MFDLFEYERYTDAIDLVGLYMELPAFPFHLKRCRCCSSLDVPRSNCSRCKGIGWLYILDNEVWKFEGISVA